MDFGRSSIGNGPRAADTASPAAVPTNGTSATPAAGEVGKVSPGGAAGSVALPVVRGQTLQATVVAAFDQGVWLGWRGGVFAARTALQLQPGRSYEFSVASTDPHVVLSAARPLATAAPVALAPLSGASLVSVIQELFTEMAKASSGGNAQVRAGAQAGGELPAALRALTSEAPTAKGLQAFDRALGHDQEARLLRLLDAPVDRLAEQTQSLRSTAKAHALALRDASQSDAVDPEHSRRAAQALVEGLSGIERDNARRTELGAPLWLPLPANPAAGLRDARMFLQANPEGAEAGADGQRPFTIVLLLDLSQLGEMRVDVELREDRVGLLFQVVEESALFVLSQARDDLQQLLEGVGLEVDQLQVRLAPTQTLPVADLVLPASDGQALVDIHA